MAALFSVSGLLPSYPTIRALACPCAFVILGMALNFARFPVYHRIMVLPCTSNNLRLPSAYRRGQDKGWFMKIKDSQRHSRSPYDLGQSSRRLGFASLEVTKCDKLPIKLNPVMALDS